MRGLRRYWGYAAFVILITAWWSRQIPAAALLVLSVVDAFYFLFQAPLWCGAVTRQGKLCRNNSSGLLMGCHYREHKWQRLKMTIVPHAWRQLNRELWTSPGRAVTTLASMGTFVSAVAAVITLVAKK